MVGSNPKVKLTLFIDKKAQKVLFAEAGKDFVDFLFHLLSLPAGIVAGLLKEKGMMGCLVNLYESIENLSESYLQPNQIKNSLLNPRTPIYATEIPLLLSDPEFETRKLYTCSFGCSYVAEVRNLICPSCREDMDKALSYAPPSPANAEVTMDGGFVNGLVTFLVMDDLQVMPISAKYVITALKKYNIKDVGLTEEMVVELGLDEGLELLKLSFECKTVLTRVFLGKTGVEGLKIEA